ncbi:hypothetical protein LB566_21605 [Mesorhizobium sp. CA13]|uniref:hypothetical protein n=1 Tax=unclassified Mesorhizobium TaxID=325217 RepID=UPI0011265874|nr:MULTISPECIES: hypothetical protein [unclassified Mesorhizobium]MBZ9856409.1 hypothetical protein [Mesorhizobium sp. CA13]MBZ9921941.1 hypothetical protein [Mesorhizobium sp. BR1-1-7]MBZ9965843.1 hypothetical protein [Mesorhizobium sp. BR1-1-2]MCA0011961.1 hypothetical protein [Mesorhizobium sp. B294B1A1]MCA0038215.1 hypothetical protein [Mesorhizobium sp. B292B1B]
MSTKVIMSVSAGRRLGHAQAWLRERGKDEEVLIVGATLAAAGELARNAARTNGVAFGWHRHSWAQFVRALPGLCSLGMNLFRSLESQWMRWSPA